MQTRYLRSLLRISKVGSFAKAADQLNMTLSALSMQMKSLEAELAVELFDRSVRPPRLTPMGRAVVDAAEPLLAQEDRLAEVCQPSDALVGRFRMGFVTTAAVRLLPGFLQKARREAPLASFEFETGLSRVLQSKVLSGQLDAAVVTDADGLPRGLEATLIREEALAFAVHGDLLGEGLPGLFARATFFHFMPDTGIGKVIASEMAKQARPKEAETIVLDNLEVIIECVASGLGFTLLPEPDVDRYRPPEVRKIPSPRLARRTLVLATLREGGLARRAPLLRDLLASAEEAPGPHP